MSRSTALVLSLVSLSHAARIPFSPGDLWLLRTASDPRVRPDGRWVIYVETRQDPAADAEYSNLWMASADGRERRPYTQGPWRDWSPRWSPDGSRVAWLSDRSGTPRIYIRGFDTPGETPLATGDAAPLAFAWSAGGDAIAFTARLAAVSSSAAWAPAGLLPYLRQPEASSGVLAVSVSGGSMRRLSNAASGCRGEPSWALDGKSLAAACEGGIYLFPSSGGAPRVLTNDAGRCESPLFSPDGGRIAYLAAATRPQSYTIRRLHVMNADGTRDRLLAGELDRDASDPQWSSESRTVYFLADDRGATHVYAARNDGAFRQVTSHAERLRGFSLADNGRAASVRSTAAEAGNVVTFTVDTVSQPVTLAAPSEHLLAERDAGAVEAIPYDSDGRPIQAWLIKPPAFDPAHKYPLLVDVADDPRRMYGPEFELRAQILAAAGFVVLHANPRGTPGYGEEFGHLLRTRYPGDDFDDLMRGVDRAVATGSIDPQRLHIVGGLLSAWAIGHTPRFRSAVARRPIADWTADVAVASDGSRRAAEWMAAFPWDDPEQYRKHSPIYFARNFRAPTLILAGEHDPESEELYFALRSRKVECEMVRLPEGRPGAQVLELQAIIAWLAR